NFIESRFLNRLLPLFAPLIVFILLEIFFFFPKTIYVILILVNFVIFFTLWQIAKASNIDKRWWNFLILPVIMSSAIIVYSIFLKNKIFIQLFFITDIILLYFYLQCIYYYLLNPAIYKIFSIENISFYSNFFAFFLFSVVIYGLQSFLNTPIWLLELAILVISILMVYQITWANKIDFNKSMPYIFICCLVLVELSWSIFFLPFNYNIAGFILAIFYYILVGLVKDHLLGGLDKKTVKTYLGLGLISLFLILLTAQWI
ncbi:hypothetical protein KKH16_00610, partial [Patescibacteria group bacterium]|nr:hypothetical protein [Patescibacteria group bacterium]MBU1870727.1 hypothetical protein [Patescibacteria group bacterium]